MHKALAHYKYLVRIILRADASLQVRQHLWMYYNSESVCFTPKRLTTGATQKIKFEYLWIPNGRVKDFLKK